MGFALLCARAAAAAAAAEPSPLRCDVLVAGGSTASLAAALTAAVAPVNGSAVVQVCLTEPTDELGGQLAFNPALDYGYAPRSRSVEWAALVAHVTPEHSPCWVSKSCYAPARLRSWVQARLAALPNLHVLKRTVVRAAVREPGSAGRVTALTLVTRVAQSAGTGEWGRRLSESLADWYSPHASTAFQKVVRNVSAAVVIEATELGDVLATALLPHTQGVEIPTEESLSTDDGITQSACFTFWMELLAAPASVPDPAPVGNAWTSSGAKPYWGSAPELSCCCGGENARPDNSQSCTGTNSNPLNGSCIWPKQCSWAGVWAYRRSTRGVGPTAMPGVNVGDVSMINWGHGNDMAAANVQLPSAAARATVRYGNWSGGVNLTAVRMAEDRAYGWFHAMASTGGSDINRGPTPTPPTSRLIINRNYSGTENGLAKFFYVRDTRRAIGLDGFRLRHDMMMDGPGHPKTGVAFTDAIGLGGYNFDVKPGEGMGAANGGPRRLPPYMWNFTSNTGLAGHAAPFSFPFRAITVRGAPNVLTAGKTIAMTFAANTAAREHLDEWSCGVGAGAAAALMAVRGWNSRQMLDAIATLQDVLRDPVIGQPLSWDHPRPSPPPSGNTFVCEAMRCFQSDHAGTYANSSCIDSASGHSACGPLQSEEFLLLKGHWQLAPSRMHGTARVDTTIKKSEHAGSSLPPSEKRGVRKGTTLRFRTSAASADGRYWLAQLRSVAPA